MGDVIKSQEKLDKIQSCIVRHCKDHYLQIWKFGLSVGLTISDLLAVNMKDAIKALTSDELDIIRQDKIITLPVKKQAKMVINQRLLAYPKDDWLFQAHSRNSEHLRSALSRMAVYKAFADIGKKADVKIGEHTMRKAFGYKKYQEGFPIHELADMFGHNKISTTYDYLEVDPPLRQRKAVGE